MAAVEKRKEKRKPAAFFGYRNRGRLRAPPGAGKASKKEWQRSKSCERTVSGRISGTATGDVCERRRGRKKRAKRSGSGRKTQGRAQARSVFRAPQQDITGRLRPHKQISSLSTEREVTYTEGYRSGHNGAVLKTVRAKVHAGSNPAPSAIKESSFVYQRQRSFLVVIEIGVWYTQLDKS